MIDATGNLFADLQVVDQYTKTFKDYVDADGNP